MGPEALGKLLVGTGVALVVAGGIVLMAGRLGLGRLPGDIHVSRGGFSFSFPIVTCIVVSIVLTVLLNLFRR
ncbi:DUF2905 family protein [bacterium]|nr:DUF2905 family protein [bacterium]